MLAALTSGLEKSLRSSQASCEYLAPLQLNHLTTDNGRNSYFVLLCLKPFCNANLSEVKMTWVILLVL